MAKTKYKNKKVVVDGIEFDSALEARYYKHLKLLKAQGIVIDFELQPKYTLLDSFKKNGKTFRAITYNADFEVYYTDGHVEVVDVKGMVTQQFELRRKLFEYRYPYELKVITYSKIDGGWITHDELKKARKARKKAKKVI
ncbi:DUF1064 domain-containing protein [Ureibacillus thermophilus]|uniref:DUF1064 domain-containing protein n=1 Tax=Ureibacillus thermophilus TaxID=367743 RepID=A0A4P6UWR8_9BACL|nr:DUF1064 domain-containing protein [Ureibacillus thermophilus]QBK26726.1 DUF1064 domain-containing protein [Ureibacillus thermophilus]